MSTEELDALLATSDSSALRRLRDLAFSDTIINRSDLPGDIAEKYMCAFHNASLPIETRRWLGLVLRKIIEASRNVTTYLTDRPGGFALLGETILSRTEPEQVKIIAGVVMRQALDHTIDFRQFWPSDKVPDSVPNFPREAGREWMTQFQDFLDTSTDLKLVDSKTDPIILFPVSITASDGFRFMDPHLSVPVLLIQDKLLTVIVSDASVKKFTFIDVPVRNVLSTSIRASTLHDSQSLQTDHKPCDAIITFKASDRTFRVNGMERNADMLSILFKTTEDAKECKSCIDEVFAVSNPSSHSLSGASIHHQGGNYQMSSTPVLSLDRNLSAPRLERKNKQSGDSEVALRVNGHLLQESFARESILKDSISIEMADPVSCKPTAAAQATFAADADSANVSHARPVRGTLPKVKRSHRSSLIPSSQKSSKVPDEFDFPVDMPTMDRSLAGKGKASATKSTRTASRKAEVASDQNVAGPDLIPQQPNQRPENGQHSSGSSDTQKLTKAKRASSASGNMTNLKCISAGSKGEEDIDTPAPTQNTNNRGRMRRRVAKPISYDEAEDSNYCESDPDYIGNKYKKGLLGEQPKSATRKSKTTTSAKTDKGTGRSTRKKVEDSQSIVQAISNEKHVVLSKLVSDQPASVRRAPTDRDSSRSNDQRAVANQLPSPRERQAPSSPRHTNSERTNHQAELLNRLNDGSPTYERQDKTSPNMTFMASEPVADQLHVKQLIEEQADRNAEEHRASQPDESLLAAKPGRKRAASSKPPQTPTIKRIRPQQEMHGSTRPDSSGIFNSVHTINRPKVMGDDPLSPCSRRIVSQRGSKLHQGQSGPTPAVSGVPLSHARDSHTPMHQSTQTHISSGPVALQILSSNSKPVPASPRAASTAISGHAKSSDIEASRKQLKFDAIENDPFAKPSSRPTLFTRRLTEDTRVAAKHDTISQPSYEKSTIFKEAREQADGQQNSNHPQWKTVPTPSKPLQNKSLSRATSTIQRQNGPLQTAGNLPKAGDQQEITSTSKADEDGISRNALYDAVEDTQLMETFPVNGEQVFFDGDETLVAQEGESVVFPSSPPAWKNDESSCSSTSGDSEDEDEPEPSSDPSVSVEVAEEMEWEATLQPHQQALWEQLLRVSRRVVRHVVGNETAVGDIVDTYKRDGRRIIDSLVDRTQGGFATAFDEVENKRAELRAEFEKLASDLRREKNRYVDPGTAEDSGLVVAQKVVSRDT